MYIYTHILIYEAVGNISRIRLILSVLRIVYLAPRMFVCVVFSCLAILRVEGSLSRTLQHSN